MHARERYNLVHYFLELGLNDCQIGRVTGIPRGTVRDWRRWGCPGLTSYHRISDCPICAGAPLNEPEYAYLLGLYLGDGCLSYMHRDVFKLRVVLDQRYPRIIDECAAAMKAVRPQTEMRVGRLQRIGCFEVTAYWKHWPCLFPQHGPGVKHQRKIELIEWQKGIVKQHPDRLLRGLIHSDGTRGLNRVCRTWGEGRSKWYAYPRYQFTNVSDDIRGIFCSACDDYGVAWRQMNWRTISIAKAADVAKLDRVIGPKT